MNIALHLIEPWLILHQNLRLNLAESGMENQTVGQLLEAVGGTPQELLGLSLANTDTRGSPEMRQAIADLYPGVTPEQVLVTTGTSEALLLYYHLRHRPGANVVVPTPAFQSLNELPRYIGFELREHPLSLERGFRPDLAALARQVDANTRTIVLNTPHNPTGVLFTDEEVEGVLRIAEEHGTEVLADEHYRFVPLEGEGLLPSLVQPGRPVVAVGSMIKCMGCVGLRVGWLIGPTELIDAARDLKDYTTHTLCATSEYLATRSLQAWPRLMRVYRSWVQENVRRFGQFVARHQDVLGWVPPQAGIVAFPYLKDRSISSARYAERLVERCEVVVLPGETFGRPGHFRVGFGLSPEAFGEALERWSRFNAERGWS